MEIFTKLFLLLFVLLNPFTLSVYLFDLLKSLRPVALARQLFRGGLISFFIFSLFAWGGAALFADVLQVRFASFQIFGGITFLILGIRLILGAGPPVRLLHPKSQHVSGSIAMPFMVGPATISASVLAGSRLPLPSAFLVIALAVAASLVAVLGLKVVHDFVKTRSERLIDTYAEVAGRVTALFTGTFAIEMILNGIEGWLTAFTGR